MKRKALINILSFFILCLFLLCGCELPSVLSGSVTKDLAELTVSFIDVGQGDSTLIECNGYNMLIDAGTYGSRYSVLSYLSNKGIRHLDYCVATHPHSDHVGGMDPVIYNYSIGTLLFPKADNSSSYNYMLDAADERDVTCKNPNINESFDLGGATVTVLSPESKANYDNTNNYSMVLKLEYENVSFLFMGDSEKVIEKSLIERNADVRADVLKCGHHGSSTSSSPEFISKVNPAAAVISCGKGNDYGHPHDETLFTLSSRNIPVFRTDTDSTIVARSDGETITFSTSNGIESEVHLTENTAVTETNPPFVGNKNSKVFHESVCSSVGTMKDINKVYFSTATDATAKGYKPCSDCKPD